MKKILALSTLLIALLALSGPVPPCLADVIFSNYDEGDTHSTTSGWAVLYNVVPPHVPEDSDWDMGMTFTPVGQDYYLDKIEVTVGVDSAAGDNVLDVLLMSDDNGQPGDVIEAIQLTDAMPEFEWFVHIPPIEAESVSRPILTADTPYWVVLSVPVEGTWADWFKKTPMDDLGVRAMCDDGTWGVASDVTPSVFRVSGTPVVPWVPPSNEWAPAQTACYGNQTTRDATTVNYFSMLLIPVGAVIFLRALRRKQ